MAIDTLYSTPGTSPKMSHLMGLDIVMTGKAPLSGFQARILPPRTISWLYAHLPMGAGTVRRTDIRLTAPLP